MRATLHLRLEDAKKVLAAKTEDEFELLLPDHFDKDGNRVGEGGYLRAKRGDYLTADDEGNFRVYSENVFAKTHKIFVASTSYPSTGASE